MRYDDNQFKYWIWYTRIQNISYVKKAKLLEKYKKIEKIFNLEKEKLLNENLNFNEIQELLNNKYRENLEQYKNYMIQNKIEMITLFDKEYPQKLKMIYDKPIVLFAKGNTDLLKQKSVSIVGSRNCSEYGKNTSRKIAYELSKQNICIISGLAKGIDKYSHLGALQAKGNTIAVIGKNLLDNIYPLENKKIYERIVNENGLIITEYIVGTKPNRLNFPARNRIISALSDAILVVEAGSKSGALITADFGLEQGKDIFAVPGNINNYNSMGTNNLIKQGAYLVTSSKDITDVLSF